MKKVLWMLVSFLLVAALVLSSCAEVVPGEQEEEEEEEPVGEQEEEEEEEEEEPAVGLPQYGGTFSFFLGNEPPSPAFADANFGALIWLEPIQEMPLIGDVEKYGPRGTGESAFQTSGYQPEKYLKGALLESWEVSLEKIVWHVRPGIYWAADNVDWMENRELTAEDVAEDIITFLESPWGGRFEGLLTVGGVSTPDRYTVVLELESYSPTIAYYLGYEDRALVSPPEMIIAGADKWENQVGTGGFMFEEYVIGSHMSYVRNPDYWKTTTIDGVEYEIPFVDRLVCPIILDVATQMAALTTGTLDIVRNVSTLQWDMLDSAAPGLEKVPIVIGGSKIMFRSDEPPFDDVNVRRAVVMGTDLTEFHKLAMATGQPLVYDPLFPVDPSTYIPLEELPADTRILFEYHPDTARQMIIDAGYPDGFKTTLLIQTVAIEQDRAALLQSQWAKIGIELEIDARDHTTWQAMKYPLPEPIYHGVCHDNLPSQNPVTCLDIVCHTGGYMNYGMYSNPTLDELIDRIRVEFDGDTQRRLIKEAALIWYHDAPQIILHPLPGRIYWWPWVKNYYGEYSLHDDVSGLAPLVNFMWIDQDLKEEMGY